MAASDISAAIIKKIEISKQLKKEMKNEVILASLKILIKKGVKKITNATAFAILALTEIAG